MNEKQQVEHRQCGDVRASIRAIPTQYGELQTVLLQREWIGRDGETRYADDLRLRDLPEAIDLLGEILAAENDRRVQEASDQEAPGADEEGIPELPASPALKRMCRQDPFPSCAGLQKQPIGYSLDTVGLDPREAASTDPHTWKYDEAELACWRGIVRSVLQEPEDMIRRIVSGSEGDSVPTG